VSVSSCACTNRRFAESGEGQLPRNARTRFLSCRNSLTAWRTRAETGASDFFDIAVSSLTCLLVSQTTVLFITL